MTQSTVCDTESRTFEVTPAMRERFEEKLSEYLDIVTAMWGGASGRERELAVVADMMRVPERTAWMDPQTAVATLGAHDDFTGSPELHLDGRDALRTVWSLPDKEALSTIASVMGVSVGRVREAFAFKKSSRQQALRDLNRARTALYRHYDADGLLLYIGITQDFKNRDSVHGFQSPWWKYVADSQVEWFASRTEAVRAESSAIKSEDPLFNSFHSRLVNAERKRSDYLMSRRIAG